MQELIKDIVIAVADAGLTQNVYFGFHLMDFVSVFLLTLWYAPKLNLSRGKGLLVVLIVYPIIYVWMLVQFWIESGFRNFGGQHMVSMFIWIPLVGILAARILKIDWKTVCFFMAPCIPLIQTVGHLGCIFSGCCQGFASSWGLYNIKTGMYHFPIQPIESLIALLIVFYLMHRAKKMNYEPDSNHYPLMMILYGSTRFICEFFRDNEKLLWGCSKLSFHALFMCLVGIAALIIISKKEMKLKSMEQISQ